LSNDEAYRIADTAARLLKMVSAAKEAAAVEEIGRELLRLRFEAEAKKAKKDTGPLAAPQVTTLANLKPWRKVVALPDVASGRCIRAEFADLSQMVAGIEPNTRILSVFRRTYLTEGC
jgi:hypothetical protein